MNREDDLRSRHLPEHVAAFLSDVVELAELQSKLLLCDVRDWKRQIVPTLALLVGGVCLALACVPVALLAGGFLLAENTALTQGQGVLFAALAGVVVAAAGVGFGWFRWRGQVRTFERSRAELQQNVEWVKIVLSRLGRNVVSAAATSNGRRSSS